MGYILNNINYKSVLARASVLMPSTVNMKKICTTNSTTNKLKTGNMNFSGKKLTITIGTSWRNTTE